MHFREVRCFFNWLVRPAISRRAPSAPSATCDSPSGSSSRSQRKRSSGSSLADFSLITAAVIELLPRILDEASRFQRAPAEADMLVLPPAQRAAASVTERSALSRDAPRSRLLRAWNHLTQRLLAYQAVTEAANSHGLSSAATPRPSASAPAPCWRRPGPWRGRARRPRGAQGDGQTASRQTRGRQ